MCQHRCQVASGLLTSDRRGSAVRREIASLWSLVVVSPSSERSAGVGATWMEKSFLTQSQATSVYSSDGTVASS